MSLWTVVSTNSHNNTTGVDEVSAKSASQAARVFLADHSSHRVLVVSAGQLVEPLIFQFPMRDEDLANYLD